MSRYRTTLRRRFNRRLFLLLLLFSVAISVVVVQTYHQQTDRLNHAALADTLTHLAARFSNQQRVLDEAADHLVDVTEWSGILGLGELQRNAQLHAFLPTQSDSMEVDGLRITDARDGRTLFEHWRQPEQPAMHAILPSPPPLWLDDGRDELYSIVRKEAHAPGKNFLVDCFKAWDSATLNRIGFPGATVYLMLGNRVLLSSAGSLALEVHPPSGSAYAEIAVGDRRYIEGARQIAEAATSGGAMLPLQLIVRIPEKNPLTVPAVIAASVGIILLFGLLLFMVLGHWMGRLGARLDTLSNAGLHFRNAPSSESGARAAAPLLQQSGSDAVDQIGLIAHELSALMDEAAQREEEQRSYLQTLEMLQDAVIELAPDGRLLHATDALQDMTGMDAAAIGNFFDCLHPDDADDVRLQIGALDSGQKPQVSLRFRIRRPDGGNDARWVEGRFAANTRHDRVISIRGVVRDITSSYQQEHQISHMALHDALTDLPNRVLLEDRMNGAISRAVRNNRRVALGFIDLDHFKQVNDNFGHKIGDRLLKEASRRLLGALRGTDTLSRWGGDEFVVLCPDLKTLDDAREITQKLAALTAANISLDGTDFPFTFSAGFAVFPDDADNGETLLAQADRAMFYAKAQGRNNIQFFNTIAGKEIGRHNFYIQSRLAGAIHAGQIQAWLQPLIGAHSGLVIGAEVLARWHEPEQGWIPPSVFIPMAESLGLIDKLGQSVWQQALQAVPLLPAGHRLSVNLSKRQLFSANIVEQFCEDVAHDGIEPGRIMLEITESLALSDVEYARERIAELAARGFGIAVDDFGVGYSSLSQLHEIPAAELKLDISFVKRVHEKSGASMVAAIISIAKSLQLECVAEGVEDEHTAAMLGDMGVDILQGYHYARPMPIEDYLNWLEARGGQ